MPNQPLKCELRYQDTDRGGTSDKVYKLELASVSQQYGAAWNVHFLYGRRGGALKGGIKNSKPVGYAGAAAIFFALVREKVNKGYRFWSIEGDDPELRSLRASYSEPGARLDPVSPRFAAGPPRPEPERRTCLYQNCGLRAGTTGYCSAGHERAARQAARARTVREARTPAPAPPVAGGGGGLVGPARRRIVLED